MVVASARANIALVKYWGKRAKALNLPAAGSLSLTLADLKTQTEVRLRSEGEDTLLLDGKLASHKATARVSQFLDLVRSISNSSARADVISENAFPTGAGLASSASAFAALAKAATTAYGLKLSDRELSVLARQGSGSAARSIFGGLVRMYAGQQADGQDAYAEPVLGAQIELSAAVAVVDKGEKLVGSTEGMEHTRLTSPYHQAWLHQVDKDLVTCTQALKSGDFDELALVVEGSCLAMHADAMAARPGVIYFCGATLWAMEQVRKLRKEGVPICFTVDAGPHLVAFTPPDYVQSVATRLQGHPDITRVITSEAGEGAKIELSSSP